MRCPEKAIICCNSWWKASWWLLEDGGDGEIRGK